MRRLLAALLIATISHPAHARCVANDVWSGDDKNLHFAAGVAVAALVTTHSGDPDKGFYTGTAIGVAKEVEDALTSGECTLQDLAATAAGAALGAYLGSVFVTRVQGRTTVSYAMRF
ncbi:MAG TPA: hypothetical protein VK149_08375 [Sideroxyarcus sp.]|nr:hypothetical protein [Sideroxyarcus sp.]